MQNCKLTEFFYYGYWCIISIFATYLFVCIKDHTINLLIVFLLSILSAILSLLHSMFLFAICVINPIDDAKNKKFERDRLECRRYFINEVSIKTLSLRIAWITLINIIILHIAGILFWVSMIRNFSWNLFGYIIFYIVYIMIYKKYLIITLNVTKWTDKELGKKEY